MVLGLHQLRSHCCQNRWTEVLEQPYPEQVQTLRVLEQPYLEQVQTWRVLAQPCPEIGLRRGCYRRDVCWLECIDCTPI